MRGLVGRIGAVFGCLWERMGLGGGMAFYDWFWDAVNADDIANADVLGVRKLEI